MSPWVMFTAPPARPVCLTCFPDYRATNPYQDVLYTNLGPTVDVQPGTLNDALVRQSGGGPSLFHLHWEHAVVAASGSAERFLDDLGRFRGRGGRVVWTLHNLEPHDGRFQSQVADLRAGLIVLVDAIHLHSLQAVVAARSRLALPPDKIRVIAHPSYEGVYPVFRRDQARAILGLSGAHMVVLLPGRIAAYKQPASLIAAFRDAAGPHDRLIIAGQTVPGVTLEPCGDPRVILKPGFASADDLAMLHAAADIVALPYAQSLTSGSAVLAATLGRGVLGPESPGLRDAVHMPLTGLLYDPAQPDALGRALASALREGPEIWAERGAAALRSIAGRDPRMIAAAWRDLIASVMATASPGRVGANS